MVAAHLPGAVYPTLEATYIDWLVVSALRLPETPAGFFREQAGVVLTDGRLLDRGHEDFVRIVFATPRPILAEATEAMGETVQRNGGERT